ncbi:MAG: AIPR family protein, partial [Dolichospermum sp.]
TFLGGVEFFFGSVSELPPVNDQIKNNQEIMESIYNKSPLFKNRRPISKLYYVTTGKWENDQYITSAANKHKRNLESLKLFQEVNIHFFGSDEIQSLYQFINNKISKEIVFPKKIALPEVSGVQEAYIGILPALEYLKLITDDYNNIITGLFYDNVRGYQGENEVNKEIKDTILSGNQESFVLYNNGITIVAEEMKPVGDKISLFDYQIVNGCQTSYVL